MIDHEATGDQQRITPIYFATGTVELRFSNRIEIKARYSMSLEDLDGQAAISVSMTLHYSAVN